MRASTRLETAGDARSERLAQPTCADLPPPPRGRTGWPWTGETPAAAERRSDGSTWPRISVVTPSYQQGAFLEEAIRSVLLQGYPNLEYIVLDGGSDDETSLILERYAPWLAFCRSAPDGGQVNALNEGFARATGQWRAWLNSDDVYAPGALLVVGDLPESTSWVVGETAYINEASERLGLRFPLAYRARATAAHDAWVDVLCARASGTALPQQSAFWTDDAHHAAGELDESLELTFDHEFWVRLARAGFEPTLVEQELAWYRRHAEQKTRPHTRAAAELEEARVTARWLEQCGEKQRGMLVAYRRSSIRRAWAERARGVAVMLWACRRRFPARGPRGHGGSNCALRPPRMTNH